MRMSINPSTGEHLGRDQRLVFDEQKMSYVSLARGERLLTHPVTSERRKVEGKHKLVFDWREGKFVFLPKEKNLLENPFDPTKAYLAKKLCFDLLKGTYISLQKGEKLRFDLLKNKFVIVRRKRRSYKLIHGLSQG